MKEINQDEVIVDLINGEDNLEKRTSVFSNIIGQDSARNQLVFYIMSHSNSTAFPTLLFTGSHGLGKSFFAKKVAEAMGRELVEVNCANIKDSKKFIENIIIDRVMGNKPKTILLDEAHELPQDVETVLLSILNPTECGYNNVEYKGFKFRYDFRKINVIFATTDSYKMSKPLLNRCAQIYFRPYNNEDILNIVQSYINEVEIACDKNDLAYACRGRARDAFLLSQNIKRYCVVKNVDSIDNQCWEEIKNIFGIYKNGLKEEEILLMKLIQKEGILSIKNIAIRMGVGVNNVESELEVRPKELGFVSNSARGRYLTQEGIEYINGLEI